MKIDHLDVVFLVLIQDTQIGTGYATF